MTGTGAPADAPIAHPRRLGTALGILGIAILTGLVALARSLTHPDWTADFDQTWYLLGGRDAYLSVGPGRTCDWSSAGMAAAAVSLGIQLWIVVLP